MSIAIIAPQKFDFQDLVCIELMLRFEENLDGALRVEPKDGEDAELTLPSLGGEISIIEVQVKGAEGAVTVDTIAACLAHFPSHKSEGCLLERLIDEPHRIALLVMSGRCNDAASAFATKDSWGGQPLSAGRIKLSLVKDLMNALGGVSEGDSSLQSRRKAHCEHLASTLVGSDLQKVVQRVVVIERSTPESLESDCHRYLKKKHRIPDDRLRDTLNRLRDAVKRSKTEAVDAFPLMREVIADFEPSSVLPPDYVDRGDETAMLAALARDRVLLLSGAPRCGKSDLARWLGAQFECQGYDVQLGADVDAADRFLREPTKTPRLFILDDPLGGSRPEPEAGRIWEKLSRLIERLPSHRELLVAQSMEIMLEVTRRTRLADCRIGSLAWNDLSASAPEFLSRLWQAMAEKAGVVPEFRDRLAAALRQGTIQLEPGSLRHLASSKDKLTPDLPLEDALRIAREPAQILGRSLSDELGADNLLSSMAIATTPDNTVTSQELGFILTPNDDFLPGKSNELGHVTRFGGDIEPEEKPRYRETPSLDPASEVILEKLERRRIVSIAAEARPGFTHPFYRAAAESLLEDPSHRFATTLQEMIERALFCLAPVTSAAAARNLDWIYTAFSRRRSAQDELVRLGVSGMHSIFPATRDLCFSFLLRHLAELPRELQKKLPSWARSIAMIGLKDMLWDNGEARLAVDVFAVSDSWISRYSLEESDVANELDALNDDTSRDISPEKAAKALSFFATHPTSFYLNAIGRLLSYAEAAIRAEAVRIWLSRSRFNDAEVLARIFDDASPNVARQALTGACANWNDLNDARRAVILSGLERMARMPSAAVVLMDKLLVFDRVEIFGENPPWRVFERLMPIVMEALPVGTLFTDGRLFSVASSAQHSLSVDSMIAVCAGWINWLERELAEGGLPGEYVLAVTAVLIAATARRPETRQILIDRLFTLKGTGASMSVVRDCVDEWDDLTAYERERVLTRLQEDRQDRLWLQAVAITRSVVPPIIQKMLLGSEAAFAKAPAELLYAVPIDLLGAALSVYCGRPQPLWWIGTHHTKNGVWSAIVKEIAVRPDHPQFDIALQDTIFQSDDDRIAAAIRAADPSQLEHLFETLLEQRATWTGNYLSRAWDVLLRRVPDSATEERWLAKISEFAPCLIEDLRDLKHWLPAGDLQRKILQVLAWDFGAMTLLYSLREMSAIKGASADAARHKLLEALTTLLDKQPPRLFGTYDSIKDNLKMVGITSGSLVEKIDKLRKAAFAELDRLREEMEVKEGLPPNWVAP